jgi:hypothetical protein
MSPPREANSSLRIWALREGLSYHRHNLLWQPKLRTPTVKPDTSAIWMFTQINPSKSEKLILQECSIDLGPHKTSPISNKERILGVTFLGTGQGSILVPSFPGNTQGLSNHTWCVNTFLTANSHMKIILVFHVAVTKYTRKTAYRRKDLFWLMVWEEWQSKAVHIMAARKHRKGTQEGARARYILKDTPPVTYCLKTRPLHSCLSPPPNLQLYYEFIKGSIHPLG